MIMTKVNITNYGIRFEVEPEKAVIDFTAGRDVMDYRSWFISVALRYISDKAHCVMLYKTGIIPRMMLR